MVCLQTLPPEVLEPIVEKLDTQTRCRLALASKRLLQTIPALPFSLCPHEDVGIHNLHSLASWVSLVSAARGGARLLVQELKVDLFLTTADLRLAPMHVWQAVHRLLRSVDVSDVLEVKGLGCPVDAGPLEFAAIGRSICHEVMRFDSLFELALGMCFQGEPFFLTFNTAFTSLGYLWLENHGGGDVVLTLSEMPCLSCLVLFNLGVGGCVRSLERLQHLSALYIGGGCPRFLELAEKFDAVEALYVMIWTGEPCDGVFGVELRGLAGLAELPALEDVRFHLFPRSPMPRSALHPRVLPPYGELAAFHLLGVPIDLSTLDPS